MKRSLEVVRSICLILTLRLLPTVSSTDNNDISTDQHQHHQLQETTSSERCTVCPDGSPITNPTGELDVPGIGVQSCDVISALAGALYPLEDPNCQLLHSVSTVCGCPSSVTNPCQLCGEGNRVSETKLKMPLSYLDESMNYEGVDCQLLEIYFNSSIESDDLTCRLSQAWTKKYCCSADEWVPPTKPCPVCVESPDSIIDLGEPLKCSQVQEAASTLWEASDPTCQQVQSFSGALCGCQSDNNTADSDKVDIPMCPLCKDGSNVTTPEKLVPFMADRFFGIVPTCQQFEEIARAIPQDSQDCVDAQLVGSYCGCPAVENACVFCPKPGDAITTPTRKHSNYQQRYGQDVTCEELEAGLLQFPQDSDECFLGQEHNWECGCNDGFYGYLGTESESDILLLHWASRLSGILSVFGSLFIMQDFFRGKDKKNLYRQIVVLMSCFDFITAVGWAIGPTLIGTKDVNGYDTNILGANGSDALCAAQGFFVTLGYGSGFFNDSLSIYYVLVVVYGWKDYRLKKARPWLLVVPVILSLAMACSGIPYYSHIWIGCWMLPRPFTHDWAAFGFTLIPIGITTIFSTACQIRVYWSVRTTVRKAQKWSMVHRLKQRSDKDKYTYDAPSSSGAKFSITTSEFVAGSTDQSILQEEKEEAKTVGFNCNCIKYNPLLQDNAEAAVFWQSAFYLFAYYTCWPILVFATFNATSQAYWFWVTLMILAPAQGFFNCLVFTRPRFVKWYQRRKASKERKRKRQDKLGKEKKPQSIALYSNTSCMLDSTRISGSEEEKVVPPLVENMEEGTTTPAAESNSKDYKMSQDSTDKSVLPVRSGYDLALREKQDNDEAASSS